MAQKAKSKKKKGGRVTPKATTVSTAKSWKGKRKNAPVDLNLPSGNTCLVRRTGMLAFLQSGLIPNSLLGLVQDAMDKASKGKSMSKKDEQKMLDDLMADPTKLAEMFSMIDRVTVDVVVEPPVRMGVWTQQDQLAGLCDEADVGQIIEEDDRDEDTLYVDEVDDEDKWAIYNFVVGGTDDFESFREEAAERLAAVDDGEGASTEAE